MNHTLTNADFEYSREYWESLGIAANFDDCKCKGNGWCEYHDNFDPEDDSHAVQE